MTTTTKRPPTIVIGGLIALAVIGFGMMVKESIGDTFRKPEDCKQWGVLAIRNGVKSWAPLPGDPKNKEEAEEMAATLDSQDLSGLTDYQVACKEWKEGTDCLEWGVWNTVTGVWNGISFANKDEADRLVEEWNRSRYRGGKYEVRCRQNATTN